MNVRTMMSTGLRGLCVVALAGGLAACASNNKIDFGTHHDMATGSHDDLGTGGDLAMSGDLAVPDGSMGACIQLPSWPTTDVQAGYDSSYGVTFLSAGQQVSSTQSYLDISDWHLAMPETFPRSTTFSSADTFNNCDLCVDLCEGYDSSSGSCTRSYFVQGGSLTVDQADSDEMVGRMKLSGTNLKLVEWQDPMTDADGGTTGDKPVPNGKCYEIASVSFDAPWDNTTDGGATDGGATDDGGTTPDGGTGACHPVLNEVQTAGATSGTGNDEFVEIYNPCTTPFDLMGGALVYRSAAGTSDTSLINFTASTPLAAGAYLVYGAAGYAGTKDGTWASGGTGTLGAGGGGVALLSGTTVVDSVGWGTATNAYVETAAASAPAGGQSISRRPNGADSNDNSKDFQITATPTPRAANP